MREALKRRWLALRSWRWKADRPYRLIAFALLPLVTVAILERLLAADELGWLRDWVRGSAIYGPLFFPEAATVGWKDRLQAILVLLGLPVAFCLWYWRDRNVRDQIEEQRKQVIEQQRQVGNQYRAFNLSEFQEVQMRAAGALDEKLPAEAREQLQIAALHHLRGFLRGEYDESFRRPAFELLLSGHAEAMRRIGVPAFRAQIQSPSSQITSAKELRETVEGLRARLDPIMTERLKIIRDEWKAIFFSGYPLSGRAFDFIDLNSINLSKEKVNKEEFNLSECTFMGANFGHTNLSNTFLNKCQFEGAWMYKTNLTGVISRGSDFTGASMMDAILNNAILAHAKFDYAFLERSQLIESKFTHASLRKSYLVGSNLKGASLQGAHCEGAILHGIDPTEIHYAGQMTYDDTTVFVGTHLWQSGEPTADEVRELWRAKGARHVDEREPE